MKNKSFFLLVVFFMVLYGSGCRSLSHLPSPVDYPLGKYNAWTKSQPVVFYGRVVDWEGNPVPGATVTMTLRGGIDRKLVRTTDADGRFGFTKEDGYSGVFLFVNDIAKQGYVRDRNHPNWDPDSISYIADSAEKYVPDAARPETYAIRKTAEYPSFLLSNRLVAYKDGKIYEPYCANYAFLSGSAPIVFDFLTCTKKSSWWTESVTPERDLEVQAKEAPDGRSWSVTFTPLGTKAGIQRRRVMLSTAPEDGYQPSYTMEIPCHPEQAKESASFPWNSRVLYVRSRGFPVYTRIHIYSFDRTGHELKLYFKEITTNPFGERILEDLGNCGFVEPMFYQQLRTALAKGELPKLPEDPKGYFQAMAARERVQKLGEVFKSRTDPEGTLHLTSEEKAAYARQLREAYDQIPSEMRFYVKFVDKDVDPKQWVPCEGRQTSLVWEDCEFMLTGDPNATPRRREEIKSSISDKDGMAEFVIPGKVYRAWFYRIRWGKETDRESWAKGHDYIYLNEIPNSKDNPYIINSWK